MLQRLPDRRRKIPEPGEEGVTLVVAAMPAELRPLVRRTGGRFVARIGDSRVYGGSFGSSPLLMVSTGVGFVRAERTTRALLEALGARVLIGIGVCGALTPGLTQGAVVAGEEIWGPSGRGPAPDPAWFWLAQRLPSIRSALLLTTRGIVTSRARKAELLGRLPKPPLATVDMESVGWVRAAEDKKVPHLVLRCILDPAEEDLPPFLDRSHDEDGTLIWRRLAREALLHPGIVPKLFSLRRRVRACAVQLADAVLAILESVEPPSLGER